jgi:hypothetical protein
VNQIQERDYDDEAVYFNIPPVQRTYLSMALEQAISRRELVDKEIQGLYRIRHSWIQREREAKFKEAFKNLKYRIFTNQNLRRLQEEARQRNIDVGSAIRKLGYITARIREARSYDEFRYFQEEQEYFLRSLPPQIRMRVMTSAEKEDRDEGCPICGKINCPNWPF